MVMSQGGTFERMKEKVMHCFLFSLSYIGIKSGIHETHNKDQVIDLSVPFTSLCTCYAVCCVPLCAPLDFRTGTVLSREWPSKHDDAVSEIIKIEHK